MISHRKQHANGNAEAWDFAAAANAAAASEQTEHVADASPPRLSRGATKPVPKNQRLADERAREAHAERRQRLVEQIKVENPSRTEEEIEERLAQFGV